MPACSWRLCASPVASQERCTRPLMPDVVVEHVYTQALAGALQKPDLLRGQIDATRRAKVWLWDQKALQ